MPRSDRTPSKPDPSPQAAAPPRSPGRAAREWTDALVIAYVLAMFIRVFDVELYKIPSGSMTPTLVGDTVAEIDYDNDGQRDLLVVKDNGAGFGGRSAQVFLRRGKKWTLAGEHALDPMEFERLRPYLTTRYDRILVNKFAYWFGLPERGDLIVFKVPDVIYSAAKPIFIKRLVGLPGEEVSFTEPPREKESDGKGRLLIDGALVDEPPAFQRLRYESLVDGGQIVRPAPPENAYSPVRGPIVRFSRCKVPPGRALPLGDNTDHSYDGRYWGSIPLANIKGKAFLRYWPLRDIGFLE